VCFLYLPFSKCIFLVSFRVRVRVRVRVGVRVRVLSCRVFLVFAFFKMYFSGLV
jgi:hypothetical protein